MMTKKSKKLPVADTHAEFTSRCPFHVPQNEKEKKLNKKLRLTI